MSAINEAQKIGIFNGDAPLKVKHLFWVSGVFMSIIVAGIVVGVWYVGKDIDKAVNPLQTKSEAKESQDDFMDKEWRPHIKEANKTNINVGILIERTDSKAINTNSVGRINENITTQPPI